MLPSLAPGQRHRLKWCPFEPVRSNIDYMLQENDEIFVDKSGENVSPRSFSFGALSPRAKFQLWQASFYTKDPVVLFEAHLLHLSLKRACEVINGDFIFIKRLTPSTRKVMVEQLQLKEHVRYMKLKTITETGSFKEM